MLVHNKFAQGGERLMATFIFASVGLGGGLSSWVYVWHSDRPPATVLSPSRVQRGSSFHGASLRNGRQTVAHDVAPASANVRLNSAPPRHPTWRTGGEVGPRWAPDVL